MGVLSQGLPFVQVVVLGSYSSAVPGQEPALGAAPRYKISDEAAFGSAPNVDWLELEVIMIFLSPFS